MSAATVTREEHEAHPQLPLMRMAYWLTEDGLDALDAGRGARL